MTGNKNKENHRLRDVVSMYHHILRTAREKICAEAGKESSDPSLGHKDTVSQSVCQSVGLLVSQGSIS